MAKQFMLEVSPQAKNNIPENIPAVGERAVYRALHWGYFDAKILSVRPDGRVDVEVMAPAGPTMMVLSRIKLAPSRAECGKGEAYIGPILGGCSRGS